MIAIVGYGLGNVQAFVHAYKRLGVPLRVATTAEELATAEKVILPGVGSFDWAMERLESSGMRDTLDEVVREKRRPVLGVCVGMQMMARGSDEGRRPGLGWIAADVKRIEAEGQELLLPHMGWNDVTPRGGDGLLAGMEPSGRFYFLHSYYFAPDRSEEVLGVAEYGRPFCAAVRSGNVWGVQFHPEKSHGWGLRLLKNFAEV